MQVLEMERVADKNKFADDVDMAAPRRLTSVPATYETKDLTNRLADKWDMTATQVLGRAVEWLEKQEDIIQMAALRRLPPGFEADVFKLVWDKLKGSADRDPIFHGTVAPSIPSREELESAGPSPATPTPSPRPEPKETAARSPRGRSR